MELELELYLDMKLELEMEMELELRLELDCGNKTLHDQLDCHWLQALCTHNLIQAVVWRNTKTLFVSKVTQKFIQVW